MSTSKISSPAAVSDRLSTQLTQASIDTAKVSVDAAEGAGRGIGKVVTAGLLAIPGGTLTYMGVNGMKDTAQWAGREVAGWDKANWMQDSADVAVAGVATIAATAFTAAGVLLAAAGVAKGFEKA
jgi:hypothetical protein